MKGVIVSLDALVAALVLITMISLSSFYLGQVDASERSSTLLKETAMDTLTSLEKSGKLEQSVQNSDPGRLREYVNRLPNSLCLDLSVYNSTDLSNPEFSVLREDCTKNFSSSSTINRGFAVRSGSSALLYVARLTAWYRVAE